MVTVNSVAVNVSSCGYTGWPSAALAPGQELIVDQLLSGPDKGCTGPVPNHMDTSDIGPGGSNYTNHCNQDHVTPTVDVTVDGTTTTYIDSGQVLNTGGFDVGGCPKGSNESHSWTAVEPPPIDNCEFPPAGYDTFDSDATVDVQVPPVTGPITPLHLEGPTTIQRSDPAVNVNGDDYIDTEMTSLDLTGVDPSLGKVTVTLNPSMLSSDTGMVTADNPSPGPDFPATSFFDLFLDVDVAGMQLHNEQPGVMTATDVMCIPPIGSVYSGETVPLLNSAGTEVALVTSAQHVPSIDHMLCYSATSTAFSPPSSALLDNQFNASFPVTPVAVTEHCNPVQKTLRGVVTPVNNPLAHLLCWSITTSNQSTFTVNVVNQFGSADLTTGQPTSLCLPTWKSLTGPPSYGPPQPPGLDHFTCYPVSYTGKARFRSPFVRLSDQFGNYRVKVGAPTQLCLPTQKTVNSVVTPITNPNDHLLCFAINVPAKAHTVFDQNQFGTGLVKVQKAATVCLPSEKTII